MSTASVATMGYGPPGSVFLVATMGYGQGAAPPPPPPVVAIAPPFGAPVWWRGRREEVPEEDETDDVIRIVPTNEPITEPEAVASAVPLPMYENVADRVKEVIARDIAELGIERKIDRFIDEQERKRKKRLREEDELLLMGD